MEGQPVASRSKGKLKAAARRGEKKEATGDEKGRRIGGGRVATVKKNKRRAAWTSRKTRERERERDVTKKRDERRRKGREGMNEWREDRAGVVAGKAG